MLRITAFPTAPRVVAAILILAAVVALGFAQAVRAAAPGITTDPDALTVGEGRAATYDVSLVGSLSGAQTVTVNISSDNGDVTLVGADETTGVLALTFNATNDDESQTVVLQVASDHDAVDEGATLTHSIVSTVSGFTGLAPVTLRVSVTDDDEIGVTISPLSIVVAEPNADGTNAAETATTTYTVKLKSRPEADVTVKITSDNTADVNFGVGPPVVKSVTFTFSSTTDTTADNYWDSEQTVTVTVIEDATVGEESATLTHAIASAGDAAYDALDDMTVMVTVTDPDEAGLVIDTDLGTAEVQHEAVSVNEPSGDDRYTEFNYEVSLGAEPTHDVRVRIASSDSSVMVNPSSLTFSPKGSDIYSTAKTVRVRVAKDADQVSEKVTLTHTPSSQDPAFNALKPATVTVNVNDTTTTSLVTFVAAKADGTVSDPEKALDRSGPLKVTEGVAHDSTDPTPTTYYVKLTKAPTAGVEVTITSDNDDVTVDTDSAAGNQKTLTFEPNDDNGKIWSTAQGVTVSAAHDSDAADERASLKHDVSSTDKNFDDKHPSPINVAVTDDDVPGVKFLQPAPSSGDDTMKALDRSKALTPTEQAADDSGGVPATYRVQLMTQPTHDVTVTIRSDNDHVQVNQDAGTAGASQTLTFTGGSAGNWETPQTVTVTAVNDGDSVAESAMLSHMASSADNAYYIPDAGAVKVMVKDATKGLVLEGDDLMVKQKEKEAQFSATFAESGRATFTVKLRDAPGADTKVTITSSNKDVMVSPKSLTFAMAAEETQDANSYGWGETQTVTLTAKDDAVDGNDRSATITLTADGGYTTDGSDLADPPANQVKATIAVTVSDDDDAGVVVGALGAVPEGGRASFTVALATKPSDDVTIAISSDSAAVTVDRPSITFTPETHGRQYFVYVSAAEDDDTEDGSAMLSLRVSSADTNYNGKSSTLAVTVSDNDPVVDTVEVPGPPREVKVPGPVQTVTRTVTETVTVEVPAQPNVIGGTMQAMATEVEGRVLITRHDGGPSLVVDIGGFIRDESLGQTYQVVRRMDGMIVRQWVSPNSPLVYQIPWSIVNTQFTVPVGVIMAIPLDDQSGSEGQLVRRFDGSGDDRIFSYAGMGQWRHVPDPATLQALGFYWCDVTAADSEFFNRISVGPPHPATMQPESMDYPSCSTG